MSKCAIIAPSVFDHTFFPLSHTIFSLPFTPRVNSFQITALRMLLLLDIEMFLIQIDY
jgi:hypothetical protein